MNKLNKILLVVIVILVIALSVITYKFFEMKKIAQENLTSYFDALSQVAQLQQEVNVLKNTDI